MQRLCEIRDQADPPLQSSVGCLSKEFVRFEIQQILFCMRDAFAETLSDSTSSAEVCEQLSEDSFSGVSTQRTQKKIECRIMKVTVIFLEVTTDCQCGLGESYLPAFAVCACTSYHTRASAAPSTLNTQESPLCTGRPIFACLLRF